MKKLIFILFFAAFILSCSALDPPPEITCKSALVYNFEYDKIVFEKGVDDVIFPASFVKIMTAILAIEYQNKPLHIEVTYSAIENLTGNYVGFKVGEIVPYNDLLYALIISNANDAALVLANQIGGSVDGFVNMMNDKALEIGMTKTHFTNPTGMHDGFMETTLSDMLLLCKYAYKINEFMEISAMAKYDMPPTNSSSKRTLTTRNLMQSKVLEPKYYDKDIKGMNSGSTTQAGFCLASTKENKGLVYLCIVSGSEKGEDNAVMSYSDTKSLYDYIFKSFAMTEVLKSGGVVCEIPIKMSSSVDHAIVIAKNPLTALLPVDTDLKTQVNTKIKLTSDSFDAPIKAGKIVGSVDVYFEDILIGTSPLTIQTNIERSTFLYVWDRVLKFLSRKDITLVALFIVAAFILYFIIAILRTPGKKNQP